MFLNCGIIILRIKYERTKQEEQELAIPTLLYSKPEDLPSSKLAYLFYKIIITQKRLLVQ